jgi:serine/threonine protein phosphatase PrpC
VGACRLSLGCSTSRGKVRDRNEDHFLVQQLVWSDGEDTHEATLLVVADGMGGYQAGDRASAIVISALASALSPVLAGLCGAAGTEPDTDKLMQSLGDALQAAHQAVTQAGVRNPACKGMGSTAAVALVCDGRVVIRHIGDCRVYHQRGDVLTQVTTDQTLVNRMLERGQLTPEEAATHPSRNEVLQAIGRRAIEPSSHTLEVARGDWLIVACDGLTAHVEEATLRATARRCVPAAAALAKRLVELANEGGGTDNCTVVTAYCY